nr:sarcosine oxidase subunit gamma family protein [Kineosporia rhizophila]
MSRPGWQGLWLGPDEWLLVGRTGRAAAELLEDGLRLVDVSANYAGLLVSGPHARDLLEKAITLDLHPRAFGPGHCAQTTFARGHVILWQVGLDPAYRLMFRPSFATYFADWLIDAAQEFRTDGA